METRWQLGDSLTWTRGAHLIKGGIEINFLGNDSTWNRSFPARIVFPNLAALQTFTPVVFWWPYLADWGEAEVLNLRMMLKRPAEGVHPPNDSPAYRSTALRHPKRSLIVIPQTLAELFESGLRP